jgi:hypothetical protein
MQIVENTGVSDSHCSNALYQGTSPAERYPYAFDATGHSLSVAMPIAPIDATSTPASLNGLRCPPSINRVVRISRDIEILA